MANHAATRGEHPQIRELAGRIATTQKAEIAQLEAWQTAWYG